MRGKDNRSPETWGPQTSRPTIHLLNQRQRKELEIQSDETSKHKSTLEGSKGMNAERCSKEAGLSYFGGLYFLIVLLYR